MSNSEVHEVHENELDPQSLPEKETTKPRSEASQDTRNNSDSDSSSHRGSPSGSNNPSAKGHSSERSGRGSNNPGAKG
ncbi:hypothetical protein [Mastigocladopsis repens]|uniref:hypothetical protein n=1 Tax=Mastigocladopsis repens TaxID=221287 RepID=UPI0002E55E0D|nr:hypothetical protein [Mastigocladopsis repens]